MKAPVFFLEIVRDGKPWSFSHKVEKFEFTDSEEGLDELTLTVDDKHMTLINHPDLLEDGKTMIYFKYGFADMLSGKRKAVLKGVEPTFPQSGEVVITLKAFDLGSLMTGDDYAKLWENGTTGIKYSEIATQIAGKYGLTPVVEETKWASLRITQASVSDIEFLKGLARKATALNPEKTGTYQVYVQDSELHFHPAEFGEKPIMEYIYYSDKESDIYDFSPKSNAQLNQGAGVQTETNRLSDTTGEPTKSSASKNNTKRDTLGTETILISAKSGEVVGQKVNIPAPPSMPNDTPALVEEKVTNEVQNTFKGSEEKALEARATVRGNPYITAKKLVSIGNVGYKYSGLWYIKEVVHTIDSSGYSCSLSLTRNAVGSLGSGDSVGSTAKPNKAKETENTNKKVEVIKVDARTGSHWKGVK